MKAGRLFSAFKNAVVPRVRCMGCEKAVAVLGGLCDECAKNLRPLPPGCEICGAPGFAGLCPDCADDPPAFDQADALFSHQGVAQRLVLLLKYHGEYDLPAACFLEHFLPRIEQNAWPLDLVVAVPSGAGHMLRQGYNQAGILAKRLANALSLPYEPHGLQKRGFGKSQVHLSRQARLDNVRGRFALGRRAHVLKGKSILLVDDVFTTGATARACAALLKQAGAEHVFVLCATRSTERN